MSGCETVRRCLSAFVDGESTPLEGASIHEHLLGCESCRAEEQKLRSFRAALKGAFVIEPAPLALQRSIRARAALTRHRVAIASGVVALAAALLAFVASGPSAGNYDLEAVAAHEALAQSRLPLDFTEANPQRLAALLERRLHFELKLPALASSGLTLVGARLAQLQGQDSALVEFDDAGRRVTLAMQARRGPPSKDAPTFRNRHLGNYDIVSWDHGSLSYSLVSDSPHAARAGCAACHVTPP